MTSPRDPRHAADLAHMQRALAEARGGRPSPNPHVGAVVAHGDTPIAVGHHARAGGAHAEVAALRAAGARAAGATLYCTLEPCNHHGRTPPCTDAILEAGIARVVLGSPDPKPHVPGAVDKLRAAGVEVTEGVLADACRALVRDFARHIETGLPYVVSKAAVTLDGRIATRTGDSRWITGMEARTEAHRMRDRADAVLVGVGTVLADDPALTVRHVEGRHPTRIVLDTHLRTPPTAACLGAPPEGDDAPATLIFHGPDVGPERRAALASDRVSLIEVPLDGARLDLRAALAEIGRRDVVRLLVEGGAAVHGGLLRLGLVQALAVFIAPRLFADPSAIPFADAGPLSHVREGWRLLAPEVRRLGDDVLIEGELAPRAD